jgi:hypothetical protein
LSGLSIPNDQLHLAKPPWHAAAEILYHGRMLLISMVTCR